MPPMSSIPVVPYDPELGSLLAQLPLPPFIEESMIPQMRAEGLLAVGANAADVLKDAPTPYTHEEHSITGHGGGTIVLSVFTPAAPSAQPRPCIYSIHGGGLMIGNRFVGVRSAFRWANECEAGAVIVSPEYRMLPEHVHPVPVEDSYAGLLWVAAHAKELNIDLDRVMVAGESAGGLLAAAVALLARDRKGPALCAQLLSCPMLDDRMETPSSKQYPEGDLWNTKSSVTAWKLLLGDKSGGPDVSIYAAPARATDLSGLPPTFIDVGSAEMLRDEDVQYALKLWAHGIQTELHVWPGGFHGFALCAPNHPLAIQAIAAQSAWAKRVLNAAKSTEAKP